MIKFSSAIIALAFSVILPVSAGSFVLQEYSLVTIGDYSSTSSSYGRSFIGGNLTGNNSTRFGEGLSKSDDGVVLKVAGTVQLNSNSQISIMGGSGVVFDNSTTAGQSNNNITYTDNGNKQNVNDVEIQKNTNTMTVTVEDLSAEAADYAQQLNDASSAFAAKETNSYIYSPMYQSNKTVFDAGDESYAVFDLGDTDHLFTNTSGQSIEIKTNDIDSLEAIIINVGGEYLDFSNGNNFVGNFSDELLEKIIWNFYEAKELTISSDLKGTLLAPLAQVTTKARVDGSIGVFSLISQTQLHLPTTTVDMPDTVKVPEPSTLMLFGLAIIALLTRRSKNILGINKY